MHILKRRMLRRLFVRLRVLLEDSASITRCRLEVLNQSMSGFTLIEVLIALVVISVGVLGIIALQFHTLRASHYAYMASMTSVQAIDLEERMRANPTAVKIYVNANLAASKRGTSNNNCSKKNNKCTPKQLANYDLDYKHQWLATTYALIPASWTIHLNPPGKTHNCQNNYYELRFSWKKSKFNGFKAFIGFRSAAYINHNSKNNSKKNYHYCFQL